MKRKSLLIIILALLLSVAEWEKYTNQLLGPQLSLITNNKQFIKIVNDEGVEKAKEYYYSYKKENPEKNLFFEAALNNLGYGFLFGDKVNDAIELFKLNVKEFPESWNVYDSLGEAYLKAGDTQKAEENYEKSVQLNPENTNGINVLKEL